MPINSSILAAAWLALVPSSAHLSSSAVQSQEKEPASAPTAKPGEDGGVLDGPQVPKKGLDSKRPFTGGQKAGDKAGDKAGSKDGKRPQAQMGSKPAIEQNAFFAAIDAVGFEGDLGASVEGARAEFIERVKQWDATASVKRRQLFDRRKQASPSEPPSEEFKKEMAAIEASRPKLAELQQRVYGMLSEEQGAKLKETYEAELKRVRDELARQAEAERKAKDAERKTKEKAKEKAKPKEKETEKETPAPAADKPAENEKGTP